MADNGTVYYNGSSLESISKLINVIDFVIGPPEISHTTVTPAARNGDIYAGGRVGTRTVQIPFVIMTDDLAERRSVVDAVTRWAYSQQAGTLILGGNTGYAL